MPIRAKLEIETLQPCPHGGPDFAELEAMGLNANEVIDFSVSTNPYSCPPKVREALCSLDIDRYPDSESTEFRQHLSHRMGISPNNIVVGSGSMEIIRLIALSYFGHGDLVLILKPTFGEYEISCQLVGARIIEHWAREEDYFTFNVDRIVSLIKEHSLKGVFICNPSNPTGQYLASREMEKVLACCQEGLVVLDEAYGAFTDGKCSSTPLISRGNTVIIHSMTKDYALAGLRLGYALASEDIIQNLIKVRPPWNVNIVAQKAGILALKESFYVEECALKINQAKKFLMAELGKIGLMVLPSKTNFFLVRVGNAKKFRRSLLSRGIIVRDCTSFGLPEYVRVGVLKMSECRKLVSIIKEMKNSSELGI